MDKRLLAWFLQQPAFIEYRVRLDLLDEPPDSPTITGLRKRVFEDPLVIALFEELQQTPWPVLNSHKNVNHPLHKLEFLTELGVKANDTPMKQVVAWLIANPDLNGIYQIPIRVSRNHGGSGVQTYSWFLCDAPLLLYCLKTLGVEEAVLLSGFRSLIAFAKPFGFPCVVSPILKFRGPGKKSDPCLYANLLMLKMISGFYDSTRSPSPEISSVISLTGEAILKVWENSYELHPYLFYMGKDFRKLKTPSFWYDIVHVTDVLSRFPQLRGDPRLLEMRNCIALKSDSEGKYRNESVWLAWKEWEFGQKKIASAWLTYKVLKILKRFER
jgi:hypothetical protein